VCGIAGLCDVDGAPVDAGRLPAMCELIRHRGPDDAGTWTAGPVALGHRRLSIIDLSPRGRNPMANEDGSVRLVFNGEIYNYLELREDLLARGHHFRSETDSEVLVHLYEERELEAIAELNGMFAFALWDDRSRRLVLGRDRFGVKPLYYTLLGRTLAFASEAKAFLALPAFRAAPDPLALAEHFTFQNTFGDRTLFRDVKLLPAGCYLTCERGRIETRQYWDLRFETDTTVPPGEWPRRVRDALEAAVARQLMSDVPVGSYLSGGMDTGAISAIAARRIDGLHTFTCGFDLPDEAAELERYFDERDDARELARLLATTHHELELGPAAMAATLPHVVWHLDEPRVGISYQGYETAALIRRHVTVVLSGGGGDELFAGYPWRYEPILGCSPRDFEERGYRRAVRLLSDEEKPRFFTGAVNRALGDHSTLDSFRAVARGAEGQDALHRALYVDFKTFLGGLLLVDDKLSMAHSVEARVPFLDNDLVGVAARIPADLKLGGGVGKVVLREAMRGLLPDATRARRKQGFTPPDRTWYKRHAGGYIRDLVLGPRARQRGYFEPRYLETILDEHLRDHRDHRFLIWSLMCFEWWNRLFVDRDGLPESGSGHAMAGHPARWRQ
jgi:asparagine synthase (glutamine-hydrolysing)